VLFAVSLISSHRASQEFGATVNGASEKDGAFVFIGGAGNDVFTGGAQVDILIGGLGADILTGGNGADIGADVFVYAGATDSALQTSGGSIVVSGDDTIAAFQATLDKIDLTAFGFAGPGEAAITKPTTGFSTDLASGAGFYGTAGVAVEYASFGDTARVYVDANHDGNLGAGDMLIQLTGVTTNSITASSFTF